MALDIRFDTTSLKKVNILYLKPFLKQLLTINLGKL